MTPKEKAEELVNSFDMLILTHGNAKQQCVQCAIFSVNEQLKEVLSGFSYSDYRRKYWEEVLDELNSL